MLQPNKKFLLSKSEVRKMRAACSFNASLMDYIRDYVKAGITTEEIDQLIHDFTIKSGHTPATLGYLGYTKSCCTSINNVICHGIPGPEVLKDGDIVNVDITTIVDGWHGDQSETFFIGEITEEFRAVSQCAFDALYAAIDALTPGCTVSVIGDAVVKLARERGFSVVREYLGHGLGKRFHQFPNVPHYPDKNSRRDKIVPGLCFTIEPMINAGTRYTSLDSSDQWTVRTRDGKPSAQFEHSIMMTEDGPEILTLTQNGPQKGDQL